MKRDARISAVVLAKNEGANIGRCLASLCELGIPTRVLDSGSSDDTREVVASHAGVQFIRYEYRNHCEAYNEITGDSAGSAAYILVLDADMVVSRSLYDELLDIARHGKAHVVVAPVEMWWEGVRLRYGSLYPPKPIMFRSGSQYFVPSGHGERLVCPAEGLARTRSKVVHDDRKGIRAFLESQLRYSRGMVNRANAGAITWRDRIYLQTPMALIFQPLYSYVIRGGFLAGRLGVIYALDRVVVCALVLREALTVSVRRGAGK